jgi:hypothetical protein
MFGTANASDHASVLIAAAASSEFVISDRASGTAVGYGAQVFVEPPQKVDQQLPLAFVQARQQLLLALECRHDDLVVGGAALRGERNGVSAAVIGVCADFEQPALVHRTQRPAHRSLIEADDVANARSGYVRLDREQGHDTPFCDIEAELALIAHARAIRQFVGDEGDEGRHITFEIERRAGMGRCGPLLGFGRR